MNIRRKSSLLLSLIAVGGLAALPVHAQTTITVGTANPNADSFYPFGSGDSYMGEYQQFYSNSAFGVPVVISSVSFSSEAGVGNKVETPTYDITVYASNSAVSTDDNSLNGPSSTLSDNYGANRTVVFDGTISPTLLANNTFDLNIPFSMPFLFSSVNPLAPGQPNLLLDIFINSDSPNSFPDLFQGTTSGLTDSAFYADGNPTNSPTDAVGTQQGGLLTRFTVTPAAAPEPSPLAVLGLGGAAAALLIARKRRSAAVAK